MIEINPSSVNLLIVSDVHFGHLAVSQDFKLPNGAPSLDTFKGGVPMKDNLVSTIKHLSLPYQAMLVLGDLTSVASPSEFHGSIRAMWDLAAQVGIPKESVFFTFGNHDVDWRICDLSSATPHPEDDRYHHVAASIGGLYLEPNSALTKGPLPGTGVWNSDQMTLFIANSGYYCRNDQEYRHGKLGSEQFEWLKAQMEFHACSNKWRLLMVHHHPFNYPYPHFSQDISCLEEGAEVVDLIGKYGIDFISHGHRHHPRIFTEMRNGWKRPATFFCAGSLAVNHHHRNYGEIPNTFHVLTFERRLPNGSAFGSIKTFEYANSDGWRPIQHCKETPLDHVQSFGAFATESERENFARTLIATSLASSEDPTASVLLPEANQLSPEMRCCNLHKLNDLIKKLAPSFSRKMVGKYPEEVVLIRR